MPTSDPVTVHPQDRELQDIHNRIYDLPPCEFKYHLFHLIATAKLHPEKPYSEAFLKDLDQFISEIDTFYKKNEIDPTELQKSLEALKKSSGVFTPLHKIGRGLLYVLSLVLSFILMITGAVAGFFYGLGDSNSPEKKRGNKNAVNPALGAPAGAWTWGFVGGAAGFRLVRKWLQSDFTRKLKYTVDRLEDDLKHVSNPNHKTYEAAYKKAYESIRSLFNKNRKDLVEEGELNAAWKQFLTEKSTLEIRHTQTAVLGERTRGIFGTHAYARFKFGDLKANPEKEQRDIAEAAKVSGKKAQKKLLDNKGAQNIYDIEDLEYPLQVVELGGPPTFYTKNQHTYAEGESKRLPMPERKVTHAKLIELLALRDYHIQFHPFHTPEYRVKELKFGERDCHSFLDGLLIGLNQKPHGLTRLGPKEDNPRGGKRVAEIEDYAATFSEEESRQASRWFKTGQQLLEDYEQEEMLERKNISDAFFKSAKEIMGQMKHDSAPTPSMHT